MPDTDRKPHLSLTTVAGAGFALAVIAFVAGYFLGQSNVAAMSPPTVAGFLWPPPPPVEHLKLIDTSGVVFDGTKLNDHWTLVFFGYTHCPDICPTTMSTLKQVRELLVGHRAFDRKGQVLFVSVDAARDTPDVLRAYTDYFNPTFLAAAAPNEELYRLTEQFGVQVTKSSNGDSDAYYYDHPAYILLLGPSNQIAGIFAPPLDAADIAQQVRTIVDWGETVR
jgi:protein SCO1